MPKRTTDQTRIKFQAIRQFVSFRLSKRPTKAEKRQVSYYFNRLGKYFARGYVTIGKGPVAGRQLANRQLGAKMPGLRVALALPGPGGVVGRVLKDGAIVWKSAAGPISQTLIPASFFPDDDPGAPEMADDEAKRIRREARRILGRSATVYARKYVNGQGPTFTYEFLADNLLFRTDEYASFENITVGIVAFHLKKSKNTAQQIEKLKSTINEKRQRIAKKWRGDL